MKKHLFLLACGLFLVLNAMSQDVMRLTRDVYKTTEDIVIDGKADEADWEKAGLEPLRNFWSDSLGEGIKWNTNLPDTSNLSAKFSVLHDDNALYLFVDVLDDVLVLHTEDPDGDKWTFDLVNIGVHFRYESLEAACNASTGPRATTYEMILHPGNPVSDFYMNNGWVAADESDKAKIEWASDINLSGYSIEVKIPYILWADDQLADGTPVPIDEMDSIGFNLTVMDMDEHDASLKPESPPFFTWSQGGDSATYNDYRPSYWGKLVFLDEIVSGIRSAKKSNSLINCYPNPVYGSLTVKDANIIQSVTISDILGQEIKRIESVGSRMINIRTESLISGIYFVTVKDNKGVSSVRIIKR